MFHATLIIGGDPNKRLDEAQRLAGVKLAASPDVLIINPDPSVTIKQARSIDQFLSRKPLKLDRNICLVPQAETITIPAQNAMLKTLEEPPANSQIILLADNASKLLPTVVSRCRVITLEGADQLGTEQLKQQQQIFRQIVTSSLGDRISLATTWAGNKESARQFCLNQLRLLKPALISAYVPLVKKLLLTLDYLNANVNPKLALEQLLMGYPLEIADKNW